MGRYAVLERDEGLAQMLKIRFGGAVDPEAEPELLLISPRAAREQLPGPLRCGTVLLPGDAGHLLDGIQARSAVSYGLSHRDTVTMSSQTDERLWVAVQRELVRVDGTVLERQELAVLRTPVVGVLELLAATGAALLLGAALEEIGKREGCK